MKGGPVRCLGLLLILCSLLFTSLGWAGEAVRLKGSGASFPFPLYGLWFKEYGKANRNIIIDYQAKGSGAGIKDFVNKTVDFAASDAAMTDEEMASVEGGVQLLMMSADHIHKLLVNEEIILPLVAPVVASVGTTQLSHPVSQSPLVCGCLRGAYTVPSWREYYVS
jgi:hypothetical protein